MLMDPVTRSDMPASVDKFIALKKSISLSLAPMNKQMRLYSDKRAAH